MKILTTDQVRKADKYTIKHEPIASIDLMERASGAFVAWFVREAPQDRKVMVICGTGNNGGDGLAISRMLIDKRYSVQVTTLGSVENGSEDFKTNFERLSSMGITPISLEENSLGSLEGRKLIVIDAIFGSGLSREITGKYAKLINEINSMEARIISIDIPSGLFADQTTSGGAVVKADYVISFQVPKLAFFLPENGEYVRKWEVVNIGLHEKYLEEVNTPFETIDRDAIQRILKPRPKFFHKGDAGKALLVSGSRGKMGAAVLCARACLRSGIGLLTTHIPEGGNTILQSSLPESMVFLDKHPEIISEYLGEGDFDVIGIGPGIGTDFETQKAFAQYLENSHTPIVLDADALNLISESPELLERVPENSILTPHPGEFRRLAGDWSDDYHRLNLQREFSEKHKVIVVLKNAHSSITFPEGGICFNTTGNPGMATAGSGDVLTGIITGFLGQGYLPQEATLLSVFLHGLAGDLASKQLSEHSVIASDVIDFLPEAIKSVIV